MSSRRRPAFSNSIASLAAFISSFISRISRRFLPSRTRRSPRICLRYSSVVTRRLHGAVHWRMLARMHGRNQPPAFVMRVDVEGTGTELEDPLQDLEPRPAGSWRS